MSRIKMATFNYISTTARRRKAFLMDLLREERADIIFLQETKICSLEKANTCLEFFGHIFWCAHTLTANRAGGRFALVDCIIGNRLTRLVSVYPPNNTAERKDFFLRLRPLLDTPAALVVGGDFNCVLDGRDGLRGSAVPRADMGAAALRDAVRDFDVVDVTEMLDTFSPRFTRWTGTSQARLDCVYVSGELYGGVATYDASIVASFDHGFVSTVMKFGGPRADQARRDAPWKMNAGLLDSEEFIKETRRALQNLEEGGADAVSWGEFKIKLRDAACALGRHRGAEERQVRIHLTNTLKALLEEEESSLGSFSDASLQRCM
ncbi:uncharacterized protein LOC120844276 [Ixodes scapularis]|uniref:uncharacterized protein LOC120844276 n=1 Tax=Ixodes scapularis TaxID=6945 RepID=UPI001A9E1FC6|nr:uncharacterized protein LOC120844276 [Ixodes scapularis]